MNAATNFEHRALAMKAPEWHYQPGWHCNVGHQSIVYRKVELMAAHGEAAVSLKRLVGSNRPTLQVSQYTANGHLQFAAYLTVQQLIALRNAANDMLAEISAEAQEVRS